MIKKLNAIHISTKKPQRLINFYQMIGFNLKEANHGDGLHAELNFDDFHFAIWDHQSKIRSFIWDTDSQSESSNLCFSIYIPNLEEKCNQLLQLGIKFEKPPTELPFGGTIAVIKDPDGNRIILMRWKSDQ